MSSSDSSSSEDEGYPNSSEGQNDIEVGIGDDVLLTHCVNNFTFTMYWFYSGGGRGGGGGHQLWWWRRWRQHNQQQQLKLWGGFHHSLQLKDQQKGKGLKYQDYHAQLGPVANRFTTISRWLSGWGGGCAAWQALARWGGPLRWGPLPAVPGEFRHLTPYLDCALAILRRHIQPKVTKGKIVVQEAQDEAGAPPMSLASIQVSSFCQPLQCTVLISPQI